MHWTSGRIRAVVKTMDELDPARADIVEALTSLGDAIEAAMPGQAPQSTKAEILDAIQAMKTHLEAAVARLDQAEELARK
ncbi:MAG: hypothetical protein AAGF33_10360 [Pseudomonadota bacterium]